MTSCMAFTTKLNEQLFSIREEKKLNFNIGGFEDIEFGKHKVLLIITNCIENSERLGECTRVLRGEYRKRCIK